ncbi:MAG: hypothetical protein BGO82_06310 [Devosia sp. 67-54]|uniref:sensor histidine kinase n=1 Tax=unclassified Devosia TaxID=196773 RepID=UPI000968EC18|nr:MULTISPECIES: HAMP domain-containing sensor histidine kinase [unclassified Devosia]MBN9307516.1 HAMP domain-containing histidine kinase [Devosia sp.]OJX19893.1 MAG: hypothetical protein BGO82_06310 [Devosia sp. 67-54]
MTWFTAISDRLPLTFKVPALVVVLMIVIGAGVSQVVFSRLVATQERQLNDLADAYLDGVESAIVDPVLRQDTWEIFDALDRARRLYQAVGPLQTVVADPQGAVLAASDPRAAPIGAKIADVFPVPASATGKVEIGGQGRATVARPLVVEGRMIGDIYAELDTAALVHERAQVLWTLLGTNAALTVLLAALGWFMVRRMVRPVNVLFAALQRAADGRVEPISEIEMRNAGSEASRLFAQFNDMAKAMADREALTGRLAQEERLSSLGRLASGLAHEINNPLGGLFNALDTLKVHGARPEVREDVARLLERGLFGIRDAVRSVLATYRPDRQVRNLLGADIDDVRLLVRPEVRRKRIELIWENQLPKEFEVDAFPVRQVVLNLVLNACSAVPESGTVLVRAQVDAADLWVDVEDSGPGLPAHVEAFLGAAGSESPVAGTTGLGLWIAKRMAAELGGTLTAGHSSLPGAAMRLRIPRRVGIEGESQHVA